MTNKASERIDVPTPVKTPNVLGPYAQEIASNASVTGNLNSQFKYNQTDEGPYHEMSKGASVNRYLEKIASRNWTGKAGLSLSAASLGVGLANLHNGRVSASAEKSKVQLEQRSLSALNGIHKTLSTAQLHPSPVAVHKDYK